MKLFSKILFVPTKKRFLAWTMPTRISYIAGMIAILTLCSWILRTTYEQFTVENPFTVRVHARLLLSYYTSPWVYTYHSNYGEFMAPIGPVIYVEVLNNKPTMTAINSYWLDALVDGKWTLIPSISDLRTINVYWINNSNLKTCTQFDFSQNSFDSLARERNLAAGESIKGWVFFEWPPPLRTLSPNYEQLRITFLNSQGESYSHNITGGSLRADGKALLMGGEFQKLPGVFDLSGLEMLPRTDLRQQFRGDDSN